MSGRSIKSIMAGVATLEGTKPHKIARSTVRYANPKGDVVIRLHRTDIITYTSTGIILNSGGWQTVTTKDRMNRFLPTPHLWSQRGKWVISNQGDLYEFFDGIIIDITGRPLNATPIPIKPKPEKMAPSDASAWLRILRQKA